MRILGHAARPGPSRWSSVFVTCVNRVGLLSEWRDVSLAEFEAFLREYPARLEARPPLSQRKVNLRAWLDASLGEWHGNAVAKTWRRGRCTGYQIVLLRSGSLRNCAGRALAARRVLRSKLTAIVQMAVWGLAVQIKRSHAIVGGVELFAVRIHEF